MAGRNHSVAKGPKRAQTQKSSGVSTSSRGNATTHATQGGNLTTTNRSNRPVHKSNRLLQQEEEQREREEARLLKQQKAQQREATNKRRAQEREEDANGEYLRGPNPVPRKKPNTSRPSSRPASDHEGPIRKKANTSRPPSRPASDYEEPSGEDRNIAYRSLVTSQQAAGRLLQRQSGVAPPANTVPIATTKAKTATFKAPAPENLFDNDEGVELASHSDRDPPMSDVDMDFDPDFDDADPPATTDDDGLSGDELADADVSADEDRSGAISRVIATSKSSRSTSFDGTHADSDDGGDEAGPISERIVIRGRPKNGDLDDATKPYVEYGEKHYRFVLATIDGFPDPSKQLEFVGESMDAIRDKYKIDLPVNGKIEILLKQRGPTMRGEIKTKARALVAFLYGIQEAASQPGGKKKVRELVYSLIENHAFIYKDTKTRKGAFLNDAIQFVINESFFHNFNAIGIFFRHDFCKPDNGISPNVVALIECCLHEWQSGERTKIKFSTEHYAERYAVFCTLLREIEERTGGEGVKRLGRRIGKRALKQAGVDPDGVSIALEDSELAAAAAELGNLSEDEDSADEE
ncbi:hypothetical protein SCHPADRAFT_896096 [Schizopora paradoxa]|uniref:DUF6532 domain-containing protein n=1 Tax=Schizopora paradoxa TaxID=27342 RepID=A0A0H2R801_9AGAM|nr:hypothetical protein SCHPADRAFT_896096 [Schizopora paradoxa]